MLEAGRVWVVHEGWVPCRLGHLEKHHHVRLGGLAEEAEARSVYTAWERLVGKRLSE